MSEDQAVYSAYGKSLLEHPRVLKLLSDIETGAAAERFQDYERAVVVLADLFESWSPSPEHCCIEGGVKDRSEHSVDCVWRRAKAEIDRLATAYLNSERMLGQDSDLSLRGGGGGAP